MKITKPTTVQEAVANGAALLDEKVPSWVNKIHLEDLQMHSPCACILAIFTTAQKDCVLIKNTTCMEPNMVLIWQKKRMA